MKKVVILGFAGNCFDIFDIIEDINDLRKVKPYKVIGFLDDNNDTRGKKYNGAEVIGSLGDAALYKDAFFINGIGSPTSFLKKHDIIQKTGIPLAQFLSIIHPSASVSPSASIGNGSVIMQHVFVGAKARIGDHVIILPGSQLHHDSLIDDYCCVASNVNVSGYSTVNKNCYLGAGALIKNGVCIGPKSLIGMGSVVINDVKPRTTVAGNPARLFT